MDFKQKQQHRQQEKEFKEFCEKEKESEKKRIEKSKRNLLEGEIWCSFGFTRNYCLFYQLLVGKNEKLALKGIMLIKEFFSCLEVIDPAVTYCDNWLSFFFLAHSGQFVATHLLVYIFLATILSFDFPSETQA